MEGQQISQKVYEKQALKNLQKFFPKAWLNN